MPRSLEATTRVSVGFDDASVRASGGLQKGWVSGLGFGFRVQGLDRATRFYRGGCQAAAGFRVCKGYSLCQP